MTIGHPDFLGAVSPSPPVLLQRIGDFAAGAAWGPVSIPAVSGGSYHITLFAITEASYAISDVTINHLDQNNFPAYQDFFGGVIAGNGLPGGAGNAQAAVLRGNIYGNTLQMSGLMASSAFLNAVIPGHAYVASGMRGAVYSTPFSLNDPQPKVTTAAASVGAATGQTPQSLLAVMNNQGVAVSTTTPAVPVLAYSGPAELEIVQAFIANAGNAVFAMQEYTVANGSGASLAFRRFPGLTNGQPFLFPLNLSPMLRTYTFQNADPANAAIVWMNLNAGKAA